MWNLDNAAMERLLAMEVRFPPRFFPFFPRFVLIFPPFLGQEAGVRFVVDNEDFSILNDVQVIPTPSHLLDVVSRPFPPRFFSFFARFHRLDEAVPTSPKPEPRAKKQPARWPLLTCRGCRAGAGTTTSTST